MFLINPGGFPSSLYSVLLTLGLTSNLQLCLDAGDAESYTGSGQTWTDRSGNGYSFFRGTTSSSEGSDPTFNGTAGNVSSSEYFSFDGGDQFTLGQTNPSWVTNLHKSAQSQTIVYWEYFNTISVNREVAGTGGQNSAQVGFALTVANTNAIHWDVSNGTSLNVQASTATIPSTGWHMVGVSVTNTSGSTNLFQIDGSTESISNTLSITPSSGSATLTMAIGASGSDGANQLPNGSLIGMFAAWQGARLTAAQMTSIFTATRSRYGV